MGDVIFSIIGISLVLAGLDLLYLGREMARLRLRVLTLEAQITATIDVVGRLAPAPSGERENP